MTDNKRLTYRTDNGTFGVKGAQLPEDPKLYMCIVKLKDYEDLNVTPDEVEGLIDRQTPRLVDMAPTSKVKAVDIESGMIYTYPVVRCPACDIPMTLYKMRKYCESCGQALAWGKEDEGK